MTLQTLLKDLEGDWLVGGSCGLLLQGMELQAPPRDLDIYVDLEVAQKLYNRLKPYAEDQLQESSTSIYHSYLSHFLIGHVPVEVVGDFRVSSEGTTYQVRIGSSLLAFSPSIPFHNGELRLMPLAHEFMFNVLRQREDRYTAIAAVMKKRLEQTLPALYEILENNEVTPDHIQQMSGLLGVPFNRLERKRRV